MTLRALVPVLGSGALGQCQRTPPSLFAAIGQPYPSDASYYGFTIKRHCLCGEGTFRWGAAIPDWGTRTCDQGELDWACGDDGIWPTSTSYDGRQHLISSCCDMNDPNDWWETTVCGYSDPAASVRPARLCPARRCTQDPQPEAQSSSHPPSQGAESQCNSMLSVAGHPSQCYRSSGGRGNSCLPIPDLGKSYLMGIVNSPPPYLPGALTPPPPPNPTPRAPAGSLVNDVSTPPLFLCAGAAAPFFLPPLVTAAHKRGSRFPCRLLPLDRWPHCALASPAPPEASRS